MRSNKTETRSRAQLLEEIEDLRARLAEAEQTLQAIRSGEVDAVIVEGPQGDQVFSLTGAESVYRAIVETMNEAALTMSPPGQILYCNQAFSDLMRKPMHEVVGRTLADFVAVSHHPTLKELIAQVPAGPARGRLLLRAPDGALIPAQISASLLEKGLRPCICLVATDLTQLEASADLIRFLRNHQQELEASQELLRLAKDSARLGFFSNDLRTGERKWDDHIRKWFGIEEGVLVTDEYFWAKVHPDDRAEARNALREAVDPEGTGEYRAEYRLLCREDAAPVWVESRGQVHFEEGRPVLLIGAMQDITGRRQTEQKLRANEAQLRQLNETLEQRVAERTAVAEDRARQLQALAVEIIEAEERERRRLAEILHDDLQQSLAAARMQLQGACECLPANTAVLSNVEQILSESLTKARRLSHELSPAVLYHSGLLDSLGWPARQMKEQFELQVQLDSDGPQQSESTPLKVFLFRAAHELLFNVVKHAGVKTAQVTLSSTDSGLVLKVSDPGRGFNPDILDSITSLGGFGLLSIRERANYIGGGLAIESAPGKGSSFAVMVPISLAKADKIDHPAIKGIPPAVAESLVPGGAGGLRVVFVDDHHVMRKGLIRLMNGQPTIQVVGEAANGQEAIEKVRQLKPDVVVMDVSMPGMDGIEATRRIKAEWPEVRVIGLSMYDDKHISQKMRAAGAEAFMSKTASPIELLKAIYGLDRE
jgi:PAS domain S-box-containing protein